MTAYMSFIDDESKAVEEAISTSILDRASVNDRAVLKAIYQRVWGNHEDINIRKRTNQIIRSVRS